MRSITYHYYYVPGLVVLGADDETRAAMRAGNYHYWDSLNSYFWLDSIIYWDSLNAVSLRFRARVSPAHLIVAYECLPGIQWVGDNFYSAMDGPRLYGGLQSSGPTYFFRDASEDCQMGCIEEHWWCFRETDHGVDYVGDWFNYGLKPRPDWWDAANQARHRHYSLGDDRIKPHVPPPAQIVDLTVDTHETASVVLHWTAPSVPAGAPPAIGYELRYSASAIDADNWQNAVQIDLPLPKPAGSTEERRIKSLNPSSVYFFAIRSVNCRGFWSAISNVAQSGNSLLDGSTTY